MSLTAAWAVEDTLSLRFGLRALPSLSCTSIILLGHVESVSR